MSIRTIAGPGWVIGPSQGQKKGGRTTDNKVAKKADYKKKHTFRLDERSTLGSAEIKYVFPSISWIWFLPCNFLIKNLRNGTGSIVYLSRYDKSKDALVDPGQFLNFTSSLVSSEVGSSGLLKRPGLTLTLSGHFLTKMCAMNG